MCLPGKHGYSFRFGHTPRRGDTFFWMTKAWKGFQWYIINLTPCSNIGGSTSIQTTSSHLVSFDCVPWSGIWRKVRWWILSCWGNSLKTQAVANTAERISSRQPGNHSQPWGQVCTERQEAIQQGLLQSLPLHSGLPPGLPAHSGFRASQGSFEWLARSGKAASSFSGAPETSHWRPKHITAGRIHLMPMGPTLTWHDPKGEVSLVTLPVFSQLPMHPTPAPSTGWDFLPRVSRTSNNWALLSKS